MPYVLKDQAGNILSVRAEPDPEGGFTEIAADAAELRLFIDALGAERDLFESSDRKLIRAIEDVIDVLISKSVICITDLPTAVQTKLMERRSLRHSLSALKLLGEEDQGII